MKEILKELKSGQNGPCVSIITPAFRSKPESFQNRIILEKAIKEAKQKLEKSNYSVDVNGIIKKIDALHDEINFHETLDGVGLYVSAKKAKLVHFPFPVKEKVVVGNSFEVRDIVYAISGQASYWVLSLSKNASRLFRGAGENLEEVKDGTFPFAFEEQYERERTSVTFDPDKSAVVEIREKQYFRKVDELLGAYLKKEKYPVIVSGVKKYIGYFSVSTKHADNIIGKVEGNYDKQPIAKLSSLAWAEKKKVHEKEKEDAIKKLKEAVGKHLCVWGMEDVWQEAANGAGATLLVEKDFAVPGLLRNDLFTIHLDGGKETMQKKLEDAVDDVIEMVLKQKGKVVFVDNGKLKNFNRIALLLRY